MVKALILRAAGVGALAGLVAFVFARIFAEPLIQAAIDYESDRDDAKAALAAAAGLPPEEAGPDIFSRAIQGNLGIGVGMIFFGLAVGLFFGVAYCMLYGRAGAVTAAQLSRRVALAGFLALYLVPFLKYPANPPSIGNPDTIGARSGLYAVMVIACAVVIGIVMALLPQLGSLSANAGLTSDQLTETPQPLKDPSGTIVFPGFDPDLLYRFRLYSVAAQALMWAVIGVAFGPLAEKVVGRATEAQKAELTAAG
jgi:predicted cobalt transporter CbtA